MTQLSHRVHGSAEFDPCGLDAERAGLRPIFFGPKLQADNHQKQWGPGSKALGGISRADWV